MIWIEKKKRRTFFCTLGDKNRWWWIVDIFVGNRHGPNVRRAVSFAGYPQQWMRDRRRVGDRGTFDRATVVRADRCVAQNGPFGAHGKVVGYSRGQDYSPHLGPWCVLSASQGWHSELPWRIILPQGIPLLLFFFCCNLYQTCIIIFIFSMDDFSSPITRPHCPRILFILAFKYMYARRWGRRSSPKSRRMSNCFRYNICFDFKEIEKIIFIYLTNLSLRGEDITLYYTHILKLSDIYTIKCTIKWLIILYNKSNLLKAERKIIPLREIEFLA